MNDKSIGLGEEREEPGEREAIQQILADNEAQMVVRNGALQRAQHPKHHGCCKMTFAVRDDVPDSLKIGLFGQPGTYQGIVRFSNGLGHDDREADAHGMAMKREGVLHGVPRLQPDQPGSSTFDIVLTDHPIMFAKNLQQYKAANELLKDIQNASGFMKAVEVFDLVLDAFSLGIVPRMKDFKSQKPGSPLTSTYWSQTAFQLRSGSAGGDVPFPAVKYMAKPVFPDGEPGVVAPDNPDFLSQALKTQLAAGPAHFVFGLHVQADPEEHSVEDSTKFWWPDDDPGGAEAMIPVADIVITGVENGDDWKAENHVFSSWNVTEHHKPLGVLNRIRKEVYARLAAKRHQHAGIAPAGTTEFLEKQD